MSIQPYRTRKLRRVKVKTPTGVKTHYRRRKPKLAHCSQCKKPLHGMPRDLPFKIKQLPKSRRRPERMYGGILCPSCLKKHLEDLYLKKLYPLEVGRLCIKTSGREAGNYCVVVDKKDNFVVVDGQVKRRKCNPSHLISLDKKIIIKKNAPTSEVIKKLKALNIEVRPKKSKKPKPRPRKQRKKREKPVKKKEKPKKEEVKKKTKK